MWRPESELPIFDHEVEAPRWGWWSNKRKGVWIPDDSPPAIESYGQFSSRLRCLQLNRVLVHLSLCWFGFLSQLNLINIPFPLAPFSIPVNLQWAPAHLALVPHLSSIHTPLLLHRLCGNYIHSFILSLIYLEFWHLLQDPSYCNSETIRSCFFQIPSQSGSKQSYKLAVSFGF